MLRCPNIAKSPFWVKWTNNQETLTEKSLMSQVDIFRLKASMTHIVFEYFLIKHWHDFEFTIRKLNLNQLFSLSDSSVS